MVINNKYKHIKRNICVGMTWKLIAVSFERIFCITGHSEELELWKQFRDLSIEKYKEVY